MFRAIVGVLALALPGRAQVRVISPSWLVSQITGEQGQHGTIDGSTATFGAPFYGEDVLARLVYGDSKGGHQHCTADDYDIPALRESAATTYGEENAVKMIDIIVVRRGKCSMVTKTKVAMDKGAHAVIIVDREDSTLTSRDIQNIVIGDDGFGASVHIPTVLIARQEGDLLIDAVKKSDVVVELAWNVPTNHIVELDVWMSSGSAESLQFLAEFATKRKTLNEVMKFTPHYHVFGVPASDPAVYNGLCSDTTGEFCAEDPDAGGIVTGKEVLEEDVRQLCIHELTKVSVTKTEADTLGHHLGVEYAREYWDYVSVLREVCPFGGKTEKDRFGLVCSEALMRAVQLDVDSVIRCAAHSQTDKLREQRNNVAWSPRAIRINGWRFNGMLEVDLVVRAICAGFATKPKECDALLKPRDPRKVYKGMKLQKGVSVKAFLLGLLGVAAFVLLALLAYRRTMKAQLAGAVREEAMLEVQAQMAAYNRLHGQQL